MSLLRVPDHLPVWAYVVAGAGAFVLAKAATAGAGTAAPAADAAVDPALVPGGGAGGSSDLWGSFGGNGDGTYANQFPSSGVLPMPAPGLGGGDLGGTIPGDGSGDTYPVDPPAPADCGPIPLIAQPPCTRRVCTSSGWQDVPIPGCVPSPGYQPAPGPTPVPSPTAPAAKPAAAPAANRTAKCNGVRLRTAPRLNAPVARTVNLGARGHSVAVVAGDHYSASCGGAGTSWYRFDYLAGAKLASPLYSAKTLWS